MKIAILGSGHIGAGLGRAWAKKGHRVVFGARKPDDPELVQLAQQIGAEVAGVADAPKDAEVVVLAVPYAALDAVLSETGALAGKIVIDCTNAVEKGMTLKYGHTTSSAEELQKRIPQARVFKSFNAQGAENLANPSYGGVAASNFFCGDDADGRRVVKGLVEDVGFEAVDAGPLKNARLLEPMMLLWVAVAQSGGSRDIAFKVLRR
jgi:NADPH-dependent F420 reductase